jgi:hypothetical protein
MAGFALIGGVVSADVSGTVVDLDTAQPISGARVKLQADPGGAVAVTAADGTFILSVAAAGSMHIAASVPYDRSAARNWTTAGVTVLDGSSGVEIQLEPLPAGDEPGYDQAIPLVADCQACHPEQVVHWSSLVHAGAGGDVWVRDLFSGDGTPGGAAGYVFRDLHDPGESGFCATCHTPLADAFDPGGVMFDEVTEPGALQGVSCLACHQVDTVNLNSTGLHHVGNATYRFPEAVSLATSQYVWGPLEDVTDGAMRTTHQPVFAESRFCGSCHEYINPDTGAPGQTTYSEWLASPWAQPGPNFRTCQSCHMPTAAADGPIAAVGGVIRPAAQNHRHDMVGATPATLAAAIRLDSTTWQDGATISVRSNVTNVGAGHNFPTGVSVRNALLVISASVDGQPLVQVAGPTVPYWASDDVPGSQEGDLAGAPGRGFAKVLEGRINGGGPVVEPVLFIDAEGVADNTQIPAGVTDTTEVRFALPDTVEVGASVEVEARVLYRRAWRALAVSKGWTVTPQGGPVEIEVGRTFDTVVVTAFGQDRVPTVSPLGALVLGALLAAAGLLLLRRRAPSPRGE